ncbi:MAG: lactate utilization protein C [Ferrovum sp. 37-45-19]|uniref:LutC/YkgG family protein n=1 Tax=Ferrovum sp. JA12 TaxID=1356299 RepID=UPI000702712E|nr:lactate utilization protein C [Ferrovum sp. JA12]OYV79801.1 MAG: lactate utilization protein C [Ferrovum sp. 21-44-67]OYV95424.1 MAG: lactate utilization protein C [Ferrovum sp. 37-45-19]HQT81217.1 lactate utilization protein C [Ferrovaceae bacterium]KRH78104.1 lactate utilization protein C [Ferrovum sp. JA12]HQU05670.1 lactate utilization protein C [Ferrovaceae bacterium]
MSARDNIFARIRRGLGLPGTPEPEEREEALQVLRDKPRGPHPSQVWQDPIERFIERCEQLSTTTDQVSDKSAIPQAVANYLTEHQLPHDMVIWPELEYLSWQSAGLNIRTGSAKEGDLVGVTGAYCAIAETATLMMPSGSHTPSTVSLLPETHIALLDKRRVVNYMEDAWTLYFSEHKTLPRAVNFISGPSRTADIEQTIIIGAHGPYRVHVIIY